MPTFMIIPTEPADDSLARSRSISFLLQNHLMSPFSLLDGIVDHNGGVCRYCKSERDRSDMVPFPDNYYYCRDCLRTVCPEALVLVEQTGELSENVDYLIWRVLANSGVSGTVFFLLLLALVLSLHPPTHGTELGSWLFLLSGLWLFVVGVALAISFVLKYRFFPRKLRVRDGRIELVDPYGVSSLPLNRVLWRWGNSSRDIAYSSWPIRRRGILAIGPSWEFNVCCGKDEFHERLWRGVLQLWRVQIVNYSWWNTRDVWGRDERDET